MQEKSTPGIAPEYIVASFGVGTIYIFNITSIGSAVNPISELCALLIVHLSACAAPQLLLGASWAAKVQCGSAL